MYAGLARSHGAAFDVGIGSIAPSNWKSESVYAASAAPPRDVIPRHTGNYGPLGPDKTC